MRHLRFDKSLFKAILSFEDPFSDTQKNNDEELVVGRVAHRVEGWKPLLTGHFAIAAGEGNGKGLHRTQRVVIVQSEGIISNSSKLHHNVVLCNHMTYMWCQI